MELWLVKEGKEKRIRIDYILEFYLTKGVDLVNKYLREPKLRDWLGFYSAFIDKHFDDLAKKGLDCSYNVWHDDYDKIRIEKLLS